MSDFVSTITVPSQDDPNYLHTALHGLVAHSYYQHRIIVLWDHSPELAAPGARDFSIDALTGTASQPFSTLPQFFAHHAAWLAAHQIEVVEVTAQYRDLRQRYRAGEVWPPKAGQDPQGGVNIAFKNNVGLEMTHTEWTIPNWDTDFYPSHHWDKPIFDYALNLPQDRAEVLIPMHVQPQVLDGMDPRTFDAWGPQSRSFSCHRMAIPGQRHPAVSACFVREPDFLAYAEHNRRPAMQIRERPGDRQQLHWVPWILRTAQCRALGGFHYQGSGYDLEFDDRMRDQGGMMKVGFCDSFVLHKGFPPVEPGVCPLGAPKEPA